MVAVGTYAKPPMVLDFLLIAYFKLLFNKIWLPRSSLRLCCTDCIGRVAKFELREMTEERSRASGLLFRME